MINKARMKKIAVLLPLMLGCLNLLAGAYGLYAAEPDFPAILKKIDSSRNITDSDFSCIATVVSEKPDDETDVKQARMFRRDMEDKFVILILKPEIQKGEGYLQAGDNLWFYDPESRKFAHTSLKDNFHDSDAKNSDFRKLNLSEDYTVDGYTRGKLGKYDVYIADLSANNNEVTYPYLKLWIRRDNYIILKSEDYSLTKRLMRTSLYPGYTKVRDKFIPTRMLFINELTEGERTQVTMKDISLSDLPDSVFTKSFIERVNR